MKIMTQSALWVLLVMGGLLLFPSSAKTQNITHLEYYFDTDPGYGNGTPISITSMPEIDSLSHSADISGLADGFHFFGLRSRDENGSWSVTNHHLFFTGGLPGMSDSLPDLVRLEYFLDVDPGYGNGIAIPFTQATEVSNLALNVDLSGLNDGFHRIVIRAQDAFGYWSLSNQYVFFSGDVPLMNNPELNITAIEYYLDNDPGFGNGTPVPVTAAKDLGGIILNLDITALNDGFHRLVVRSKDETSGWSQSNQFLFFKNDVPAMSNPVSDIDAMEYFIGADPGFGNGMPVPITPGMDVNSVVLPIDITALNDGFHNLVIRSKNSLGDWSLSNQFVFFKSDIPVMNNPSLNISAVEYFINVDPGFGNGTPVSMTPNADINGFMFMADISALGNGFHNLAVRSKNELGEWSLTNDFPFFKGDIPTMASSLPNLMELEYFFDSDPGAGNGTQITLPAVTDTTGFAVALDISSLSFGSHILFIRTRDALGNWSLTHEEYFLKIDPATLPTANINYIEYFFNNDPGFGNGTSLSFTPGTDLQNQAFSLDISGLANNQVHQLYIRARDENGLWSLSNRKTFVKMTPIPNPVAADLDRIEYFIDNDPGFGMATAISFTSGQEVSGQFFQIDISALTTGFHTLFIRSRDGDGKWSLSHSFIFFKGALPSGNDAVSDIVFIEYYLNNDPGHGNGIPVSFTQGTEVGNLAFSVDISGLPTGFNRIVVRSKNADGEWSLSNQFIFFKDDVPTVTNDLPDIIAMEYFLNDDPGFGNGTPVSITAGTQVSNIAFQVDISALPMGFNRLRVRSKNSNGEWSLSNQYIFFKDDIPTGTESDPDLMAIEYFLDNDPGFGNGIQIPVSGKEVVDHAFVVDVSGLNDGFHRLIIRTKDMDGNWSITNQSNFFIGDIPTMSNNLPDLIAMEYFWDDDPGFGNGISIPVTPGVEIKDLLLNLDVSSLGSGKHILSIRSKAADGDWSLTNQYVYSNFADDIGVAAILEPVPECSFGMEMVTIRIFNYGGIEQTGFDVAYAINGGAPVVENVGMLVLPEGSDSVDYTFAMSADVMDLESFTIEAYTSLSNDIDASNDTTSQIINWLVSDTTFVGAMTCDPSMVGVSEMTLINQYGCDSLVVTNTILDTVPPVAICKDLSIDLDANGNANLAASDLDDGSTDNCSVQSFLASPNTFTCAELNMNTVTLTVSDIHGNTDTCQSTVTVNDVDNPFFMNCPSDLTVEVVAGVCQTMAFWTPPTADDNCPNPMVTSTHNPGDNFAVGVTQVTYTATDIPGNIGTCSFNVTVIVVQGIDATATPNPACFGDDVQLQVDSLLNATYVWSGPNGFASNLRTPTVQNIGNNELGTYIVDVSIPGCMFSKSVDLLGDSIAPIAVCQDVTIYYDSNGEATVTATQVDNGSTDNCAIEMMTLDQTQFDCQNPGNTLVTLMVEDTFGNSNNCTATIYAVDTIPPTIPVSPMNETVACELADFDAWVTAQMNAITNAAFDNCSIANISNDAPAWPGLDCDFLTVTFTVEDDSGLTTSVQGTYTVFDDEAPALQGIPANEVLSCEEPIPATPVIGMDITATDNCDDSVNITFNEMSTQTNSGACTDFNYTITRTWTAEDNCGNSVSESQVITVSDQTAPSFTIPQDVTIECSEDSSPANAGMPSNEDDNCDPNPVVTYTQNIILSAIPTEFTIERTWKIEDVCGNVTTETQIIEIVDSTPPTTLCDDVTIELDMNGLASIVPSDIDNGSHDNCSITSVLTLTLSQSDFDCSHIGINTVTLTITDESDNSATCTGTVTVFEDTPPVLNCPAQAMVDCNISQQPSFASLMEFEVIGGTAMDNCDVNPASFQMISEVSDNQSCPETVTRTYEIADFSGNSTTCVHSIEINDEEPPTANCLDISVTLDNMGNAQITADDVDNSSTDNCGIVDKTIDVSSFTCNDIGPRPVVLTLTDACGNESDCTAIVSVLYSTACLPPVITNDGGPEIGDPCVCRTNGAFDEEVFVEAPSGQGMTWVIQSTTLLDPATLLPYAAGTSLTEFPQGGGISLYSIQGIHLDGQGYQIAIENPAYYPGLVLTKSNVCYYPDVTLNNLSDTYCLNSPVFTLEGDANGAAGTGTFFINGTPATEFDPIQLGIGSHLIEFSFDAGTASPMDPSDPGCVATASKYVQIVTTPSQLACNDSILVSLDWNCEALITPDMILEGSYGCFDDYVVYISNASGSPVPNPVPEAFSNQWLTVTLEHAISNNSCWGMIQLEDKQPPEILCAGSIDISCLEDLNLVPAPNVVDNCDDEPEIQLIAQNILDDDFCDDNIKMIQRSWVAFDSHDNESEICLDTIIINRPTEVNFPDDVVWTCTQYAAFPNIIEVAPLHPYITDADAMTANMIEVFLDENCDDEDEIDEDDPTINSSNSQNGGTGCPGIGLDDADILELTGSGIISNINSTTCNYQFSHADDVITTCGDNFKILRTWTVIDWCTGQVITGNSSGEDNVQFIEVRDNEGPVLNVQSFELPANNDGVHSQACTSTELLLPPVVSDNCSNYTIQIFTSVGEAIYIGQDGAQGGFIPAPGLPTGTHIVKYTAIDDCNNVTEFDVEITIVDNKAPEAICDFLTDVNLGSTTLSLVAADIFDDGSVDNCCIDRFEVKKLEDACNVPSNLIFGDSIAFCCEEILNSPIPIVLRVYDCDENYNECSLEVNVSDKLPPINIQCPTTETISCDTYWSDYETALALNQYDVLNDFGVATFHDLCGYDLETQVSVNVDECGNGTINRSWRATDLNGNGPTVCTQIIQVEHVSDWVVEFPADLTVNCTSDVPNFGEPTIFLESCELIAVSYEDQLFQVVPDACYKISRRWSVINWCVVGNEVDDETIEDSETVLQIDLDGDGDKDDRTFQDSRTSSGISDTDIDPDNTDGFITYQQIIKVIDDVEPIITCPEDDLVCVIDDACSVTLDLDIPEVEDCSEDISIQVESELGDGLGPFFNVEPGEYELIYSAQDNCGNSASCSTVVTVEDCTKPSPYCKSGIIVELMDTNPQMIEVWAKDFDDGSFDNCTGDLTFSFSENTGDDVQQFTCDDLGQNIISLWVSDASGNQDFCQSNLYIQDNSNPCNGNPLVTIAGMIQTEMEEAVEEVMVELSGASDLNQMTDSDGNYEFSGMAAGGDYTITPSKDIEPLNGVTTFDLVLMTKHILGATLLDSPYKLIAADANNSGTVTTFDLVVLRKLILFIDDNFSNNTSWRFVDRDYDFPNPENPWEEAFPEFLNFNNLNVDELNAEFVAIKIGDVNNSADPNNIVSSDDRNFVGALKLKSKDQEFRVGEEYVIDFLIEEKDLSGFQFTIDFDGDKVAVQQVIPGIMEVEHFGQKHLDKGYLTGSWNGEILEDKERIRLFSLVVKPLENSQLSEVFEVNSNLTMAEAYRKNGNLLDIQLEFESDLNPDFELYQNRPNPFDEITIVGFHLPEACDAKLTVYDGAGRILYTQQSNYEAGHNSIPLHHNDLNKTGVLFYRLECPFGVATKKMVVIE